jgi:hypothetical protein
MSRIQVTIGCLLVFLFGVAGLIFSMFYLNTYAFIGDVPVVVEQHPVYNLSLAVMAGGLISLVGCGVWYLFDVRRARRQRSAALAIPERALALLKQGKNRAEVEALLLGEGHPAPVVQQALELDWPFGGGPKCPLCAAELRGFSVLNNQLGAHWYYCPDCQWVGEPKPEAVDSQSGLPGPGRVSDGPEPQGSVRG